MHQDSLNAAQKRAAILSRLELEERRLDNLAGSGHAESAEKDFLYRANLSNFSMSEVELMLLAKKRQLLVQRAAGLVNAHDVLDKVRQRWKLEQEQFDEALHHGSQQGAAESTLSSRGHVAEVKAGRCARGTAPRGKQARSAGKMSKKHVINSHNVDAARQDALYDAECGMDEALETREVGFDCTPGCEGVDLIVVFVSAIAVANWPHIVSKADN